MFREIALLTNTHNILQVIVPDWCRLSRADEAQAAKDRVPPPPVQNQQPLQDVDALRRPEDMPEAGPAHKQDFAKDSRLLKGSCSRFAATTPQYRAVITCSVLNCLAQCMHGYFSDAGNTFRDVQKKRACKGEAREYRCLKYHDGARVEQCPAQLAHLANDASVWQK